MTTTRHIGPIRAFLASLLATGLGYVYVGRMGLALALLFGSVLLIALAGWTRIILEPWSPYLVAGLGSIAVLGPIAHSVTIAIRERHAPTKLYNRWWVYAGWALCVWTLLNAVTATRADLFGFETFRIPASSMAPALQPGDLIMVDTWRYRNHSPQVGDLAVFDADPDAQIKYVKRIVAVPGDRVEIRDAVLYRNNQVVIEPYLHPPRQDRSFGRNTSATTMGTDEFYLLGDYRDNSKDSRLLGPVKRGQLHGRVEYLWFSRTGGRIQWSRIPTSFVDR